MKKIIILLILTILALNLFPAEKENEIKPYQDTPKSDTVTSASDTKSIGLFRTNIVHGVFGAIGYADMIGLCVVGQIMLNQSFSSLNVSLGGEDGEGESDGVTGASRTVSGFSTYDGLKVAHIVLAASTYAFMGTSLVMSYITLAKKIKNNMPINFPHFVSSFVTSALYVLEIITMILAGVAYTNHASYAPYIGLAHGILSYSLLASYTITLITLPIGWNSRKQLR